MPDLTAREQVELRLKAELEEAERQLRQATPRDKVKAQRHFLEALHNFTELVVDGKPPRLQLVKGTFAP